MTGLNAQWRLAARPTGLPKSFDWEFVEEPAPEPAEDQFLVAITWLTEELDRLDAVLARLFSTECRDGACCSDFRSLLKRPLAGNAPVLAIYSRSEAIVDWRARLDPHAECVEIDGSHCGMAVNPDDYREVERVLQRASAPSA